MAAPGDVCVDGRTFRVGMYIFVSGRHLHQRDLFDTYPYLSVRSLSP